MADPERKPHISVSAIKMFKRCGEMYRRRHIEKEPLLPTIPLHKGSGVHGGAELNFRQKITTFKDLPAAQVADASVAAFEERVKKEGVILTEEEEGVGLTRVLGTAKSRIVVLANLFSSQVAPRHQPAIVEEYQRLSLSPQLDLLVKLDLVEVTGEITDMKTGKRSMNQGEIDQDLQYTIYALARHAVTGVTPPIMIENMVDAAKNPKTVLFRTERTMAQFKKAIEEINLFLFALKSGVFMPAPKGSWYCSEERCGYARTCRFFQFYKKGGGDAPKPFWWGMKKKAVKK